MTSPEPSVFLAHPLSTAKDLPGTERLVQLFRNAFARRGWRVRPQRDDSVAALNASLRTGGGAALLTSNIDGIVASDLLLVIATDMAEPSSVWVEAGIALARGVPLAVLTSPAVTVPFLVRAAVTPMPIPNWTTEDGLAQAVGELADSVIALCGRTR